MPRYVDRKSAISGQAVHVDLQTLAGRPGRYRGAISTWGRPRDDRARPEDHAEARLIATEETTTMSAALARARDIAAADGIPSISIRIDGLDWLPLEAWG